MRTFGDTVTHHRATTTRDEYGHSVRTFEDTVIHNVTVAPGSSTEPRDGDNLYRVVTKPTIYLPAGIAVSAQDEFTVRGLRFGVEGVPFTYVHPVSGWSPGTPVTLRRDEG